MHKADLHLHSKFSDGLLTPGEVISMINDKNIKIASLTDHDNIAGTKIAEEECGKYGIDFINGIELSSDLDGREVHILGYFIDLESNLLLDYLKEFKGKRIQRIDEMIKKMNKLGLSITLDEILNEYSDNNTIGRPHLAEMLKKKGYVKTLQEAFNRYIGDYKYANVRKMNSPIGEIIELIKSFGGISFVAHPAKTLSYEKLSEIVKLGIEGIETVHPSHTKSQTESMKVFARSYKLLESGGSDFHGMNKYEYDNAGNFFINSTEVEKIYNYYNNRK